MIFSLSAKDWGPTSHCGTENAVSLEQNRVIAALGWRRYRYDIISRQRILVIKAQFGVGIVDYAIAFLLHDYTLAAAVNIHGSDWDVQPQPKACHLREY